MLCKVMVWAGAAVGWGTAIADVILASWGQRGELICMTALSVGIVCTAKLLLMQHQRPMAMAYDIGYEMGRRDAIRDATRRTNVSPIRRVPNGLGEFNKRAL